MNGAGPARRPGTIGRSSAPARLRWLAFAAVALGVLLPGAARASGPSKKVDRLVEAEKPEKAWEFCAKQEEKNKLAGDPELFEACATARLEVMVLDPAAPPDRAALEQFWDRWGDTAAAARAREMTAGALLEDAGYDSDALRELALQFADTPSGASALARLWEQAETAGTSDAALGFAREFPEAPQAAGAYTRAQELAFSEATQAGSSDAWRSFIDAWPDHARYDDAVQRWHDALFAEAAGAGTSTGWEAFLDQWPDHPRFAEAVEHYHAALFNEAKAGGPLGLLAMAEAHPDHPKARRARELAGRQMVQVSLADEHAGKSWPLALADQPAPVPVPIEFDTIRVLPPREGGFPTASLRLVRDDERIALSEFAAVVAEHGPPEPLLPDSYEPLWTPQGNALLNGRLENALCQPDGDAVWFEVVVDVGGAPQPFPFRLPNRCADVDNPLEREATMRLMGRTLRFGMTTDEIAEEFPEFDSDGGGPWESRCRNDATGAPEACLLLYRGLVYGARLQCEGDVCLRDDTSPYLVLGRELTQQLLQSGEPDRTADVTTLEYVSSFVLAHERIRHPGTADPGGELWVVHAELLRWIRRDEPGYLLDRFPEL